MEHYLAGTPTNLQPAAWLSLLYFQRHNSNQYDLAVLCIPLHQGMAAFGTTISVKLLRHPHKKERRVLFLPLVPVNRSTSLSATAPRFCFYCSIGVELLPHRCRS